LFKWAVKSIEDATELDAHLVGQGPSRIVVWRNWRATRIGKIIRMILRFEHVDDMGPECLRRLDDIGTGRIALSTDLKGGRRSMNSDPVLDQSIDEFRRGQKIRLIRRNNVAARVALRRIPKQLEILHWHALLAEGRARIGSRV